jgi:hypothetical protein
MEEIISDVNKLKDGIFYRVEVLQEILKKLGLNYSIFTIRDYETWKCLNYKCGKRHNEEVKVCSKCGGAVRLPLIISPRTRGGGKGVGHRRYTKKEIEEIIELFKERR